MKKILKVVENNRSNSWVRFGNFIIDRVVVYLFFLAFGFFASLTYEILGTEFFINIALELSSVNKFMDILITTTVYFLYVFLMEYLPKEERSGNILQAAKLFPQMVHSLRFRIILSVIFHVLYLSMHCRF